MVIPDKSLFTSATRIVCGAKRWGNAISSKTKNEKNKFERGVAEEIFSCYLEKKPEKSRCVSATTRDVEEMDCPSDTF